MSPVPKLRQIPLRHSSSTVAVLDDDQGILPLERVVSTPVARSERQSAKLERGVRPALEKRKHFPLEPSCRRKLIAPQASGRSLPRRSLKSAAMRIDEILAGPGPSFSVEFFPPKTEEGRATLFETVRVAARARARLLLGHLRRRRRHPRGHGRDHPGDQATSTGSRRWPTSAASARPPRACAQIARPDRRGRDRERARAARRPAARRGRLRPARGRPGSAAELAALISASTTRSSRSAAPASPRCIPRPPASRPTSPT